MIALGIILIVIAVAVTVGVAVGDSSPAVTFELFTGQYTTSVWWVFIAGALSMLLALTGGWLLRFGARRKLAQNRELRRLREIEQRSAEPEATKMATLLDESAAEDAAPDPAPAEGTARSTAASGAGRAGVRPRDDPGGERPDPG
jgi:hypothetical protein